MIVADNYTFRIMNAGHFHQPVAVLRSGTTCQIQGTQQKTSRANRLLSQHKRVALTCLVFQEYVLKVLVCFRSTALLWKGDRQAGQTPNQFLVVQIRHQIPLAVGHLDILEAWRCRRFLPVSFLASSPPALSWAISARLAGHLARHFRARSPTFGSLCWLLRSGIVCAQANSVLAQRGFYHRGWRPYTCARMSGAGAGGVSTPLGPCCLK